MVAVCCPNATVLSPPEDEIVATTTRLVATGQRIDTQATDQFVAGVRASHPQRGHAAAVQRIVTVLTEQNIGTGSTIDCIVPAAAEQNIVAGEIGEGVVASLAI